MPWLTSSLLNNPTDQWVQRVVLDGLRGPRHLGHQWGYNIEAFPGADPVLELSRPQRSDMVMCWSAGRCDIILRSASATMPESSSWRASLFLYWTGTLASLASRPGPPEFSQSLERMRGLVLLSAERARLFQARNKRLANAGVEFANRERRHVSHGSIRIASTRRGPTWSMLFRDCTRAWCCSQDCHEKIIVLVFPW